MGIFDKVKNIVKKQEEEIILSTEQESEPIKNYTEEEIIENINNSYAKALGLVNKNAISILENCKENALKEPTLESMKYMNYLSTGLEMQQNGVPEEEIIDYFKKTKLAKEWYGEYDKRIPLMKDFCALSQNGYAISLEVALDSYSKKIDDTNRQINRARDEHDHGDEEKYRQELEDIKNEIKDFKHFSFNIYNRNNKTTEQAINNDLKFIDKKIEEYSIRDIMNNIDYSFNSTISVVKPEKRQELKNIRDMAFEDCSYNSMCYINNLCKVITAQEQGADESVIMDLLNKMFIATNEATNTSYVSLLKDFCTISSNATFVYRKAIEKYYDTEIDFCQRKLENTKHPSEIDEYENKIDNCRAEIQKAKQFAYSIEKMNPTKNSQWVEKNDKNNYTLSEINGNINYLYEKAQNIVNKDNFSHLEECKENALIDCSYKSMMHSKIITTALEIQQNGATNEEIVDLFNNIKQSPYYYEDDEIVSLVTDFCKLSNDGAKVYSEVALNIYNDRIKSCEKMLIDSSEKLRQADKTYDIGLKIDGLDQRDFYKKKLEKTKQDINDAHQFIDMIEKRNNKNQTPEYINDEPEQIEIQEYERTNTDIGKEL